MKKGNSELRTTSVAKNRNENAMEKRRKEKEKGGGCNKNHRVERNQTTHWNLERKKLGTKIQKKKTLFVKKNHVKIPREKRG